MNYRIGIYSVVCIYFSYSHGEYVVVTRPFTSDNVMFDDETAYSNSIECQPKLLGRQIKDALNQCKKVDKTLKEMHGIWVQHPYMPFHVSAAETLDEFYEDYYPITVYCKEQKFWLGAAFSQKVEIPSQAIDINCQDEELGAEVIKLMQMVQQLLDEK